MITELVTRSGQTALKCYTLNRANVEAIANGRHIVAVSDGYLLFPVVKFAFSQIRSLTAPPLNKA